jgi:RNA polymerase sigma-70 factor (ECF subfamily)
MEGLDRLSDAELLARTSHQAQAFGAFYRRHERLVLSYLMSRCRDAELTADLAAETFVKALEGAAHFDPTRSAGTNAVPWLLTIARNTLITSARRGVVAEGARRRLECEPLALGDEALLRVELRVDLDVPIEQLLGDLPEEIRDAVVARVLEEREYEEIATRLGCSQQVVRKRVSRGLARLRSALALVGE